MLKVLHPSPNLNLKHFRMVEAMGFKTIALQPAILATPPYEMSSKSTNQQ
jgi:hypothetical protein